MTPSSLHNYAAASAVRTLLNLQVRTPEISFYLQASKAVLIGINNNIKRPVSEASLHSQSAYIGTPFGESALT
eukprot:1136864-Pelagomonas_calceolata.AAC.18